MSAPVPGTALDEVLVYAIGERVANRGAFKPKTDNHTRVWLAAQAGAREVMQAQPYASAPALLEALQEALEWDGCDAEGVPAVWWGKAMQAIASATGEA